MYGLLMLEAPDIAVDIPPFNHMNRFSLFLLSIISTIYITKVIVQVGNTTKASLVINEKQYYNGSTCTFVL